MKTEESTNYIKFVESSKEERVCIEFVDSVNEMDVRISVGKLGGISLTGTITRGNVLELKDWLDNWLGYFEDDEGDDE